MKPALILRTYAWLYHTILNYGPLTFRQINEMWMADKRLSDGEPMVRQTFARHRNDLEDILGVRIDCDKKHRYSIVSDQRSERNNWEVLLDAAINQMFTKGAEIHKKIILEPNFIENNYFMQILECMLRNVMFFGDQIRHADDDIPTSKRGPQNLLDFLPETFTVEEAKRIRQQHGMDTEHTSTMVRTWKSRGYVYQISDISFKKALRQVQGPLKVK